jgi:TrmH RNA methyltransferase
LVKFIGVQSCTAIAERRCSDIKRVFVAPENEEHFEKLIGWASKRGLPCKVVDHEELARVAGTEHHEGVCVEAKPVPVLSEAAFVGRIADVQRGVVIVLQGVENPHNVGAILRTACFFGVSGVVVESQVMKNLSASTCRVAEGAAEQMQIALVRDSIDVIEYLKKSEYAAFATTPHNARSLYAVSWPDKVLLIFGAEGGGISPQVLTLADVHVSVPRLGPIESLNVATCVGSVLTEARRAAVVKGLVRRW